MTSKKQSYPARAALAVVKQLLPELREACEPDRLIVAGSLRRRLPMVGDIDLLMIPRETTGMDPDSLFEQRTTNHVIALVRRWMADGTVALRDGMVLAVDRYVQNIYLTHLRSGIPLDLFLTIEAAWYNYLVCRTGPVPQNIRIAAAARQRGWHWNPYGTGFTKNDGSSHPVASEEEVFAFVGMACREPADRE